MIDGKIYVRKDTLTPVDKDHVKMLLDEENPKENPLYVCGIETGVPMFYQSEYWQRSGEDVIVFRFSIGEDMSVESCVIESVKLSEVEDYE